MKVLLDTNAFIWSQGDRARYSKTAERIFLDPDVELHVSIVSVWEMAIKSAIGKLKLPEPIETLVPKELIRNDISLLSLSFEHVARSERLPLHHRDPFDRLIIAQAQLESMPILTSDANFDKYSITRLW